MPFLLCTTSIKRRVHLWISELSFFSPNFCVVFPCGTFEFRDKVQNKVQHCNRSVHILEKTIFLLFLKNKRDLFSIMKVEIHGISVISIEDTKARKWAMWLIRSALYSWKPTFSNAHKFMPVTHSIDPVMFDMLVTVLFSIQKSRNLSFTMPLWIDFQKPLLEIWTWFEVRWKAQGWGFPTHC